MPFIFNIYWDLDRFISLIRAFSNGDNYPFRSLYCCDCRDVPETAFFCQELAGFILQILYYDINSYVKHYEIVPENTHLAAYRFLAYSEDIL